MKRITFLTIYFLFLSCKIEEVLTNESMAVSITPRILGGVDADIQLHSYTFTLRVQGLSFCSAFAISDEDIITVGHCFLPNKYLIPPYLDVTVHSHAANIHENGIIHEIEKVTIHPEFDKEWKLSAIHDIAHILLKEESKLTLDENQLKLDLPMQDLESGAVGLMTGWGCTDKNIKAPAERLQMLQMRMLNYTDCQKFVPNKILYKEHLCAFHSKGRGCARGDSGGPLVIDNVAVGIYSWSQKNLRGSGAADIFTNVFQEKGFLQSVMRANPGESSSSSPSQSEYKRMQIKKESSKSKKKTWLWKLACPGK